MYITTERYLRKHKIVAHLIKRHYDCIELDICISEFMDSYGFLPLIQLNTNSEDLCIPHSQLRCCF